MLAIRNFIKKVTHPFLKKALSLYYSKPRKYCYDDICIKVHPEVFPPHLTLSTKILLDFIADLNLQKKKVLELGCGSGIISLFATKKNALVYASDINQTALEYLEQNAENNQVQVQTIFSDLFQNIEPVAFDFIIINPPYYPKEPKSVKEQAWFCGSNFEYFESLFLQLPRFNSPANKIFMILSEDCEIEKIEKIATKNKLQMICVLQKTVMKEKNFIFEVV
jgi:release factor glutamine methyltransferase